VNFSDSLRGLSWPSPTTLGSPGGLLVFDNAVRNHQPLRSRWRCQWSSGWGVSWSTRLAILGGLLCGMLTATAWGDTTDSLVSHHRQWQAKLVKIYGAGGPKGLESYQSGFLVSEAGHIVTSWSTVLDVSSLRVVTHDGRKDEAEIVGMDPQTEIAVLKTKEPAPDFFSLEATGVDPGTRVGSRVFGLSNLFGIAAGDEALSIQRGVIMAVAPLSATRGRMKTLYQGEVLILDVMTNNPGATGGAVVDADGRLLGMLGKELRDDQTNIWLNYAIPVDVIATSVKRILEGKTATLARGGEIQPAARPHSLLGLGMLLIPDVLPKTPPFVDQILPGSIADRAGVVPNDLILLVNEQRIDSRKALESLLIGIDQADPLRLLVQRGQELVQLEVKP
jgi:S1-C subfamily serine protease